MKLASPSFIKVISGTLRNHRLIGHIVLLDSSTHLNKSLVANVRSPTILGAALSGFLTSSTFLSTVELTPPVSLRKRRSPTLFQDLEQIIISKHG